MNAHARSILGTDQLTVPEIESILKLARHMDPERPPQLLRGRRVVLLFYEPSTRTRTSFEFAAKALGATTTLITATSSSIEKGESLIDTGWTVACLGADVIVIRHPNSGAPYLLSRFVPVSIVTPAMDCISTRRKRYLTRLLSPITRKSSGACGW